jgi:hypothetical protein
LRKRWHAGELSMPSDADGDTYFGRAKKLEVLEPAAPS